MSTSLVRRLRDVRLTDAPEVGGKAASLGELLAMGARVPDGIVLTATIATIAPEERSALVRAAAADLGAGPFAVRSSGVAEDGVEHSYAGIYESILDVPAEALAEAVERVLASASGERSAGYDGAGGAGGAGMGVIVQSMIEAEAAGVALTTDPVNGDRAACVVTAVRGNGERLVSGSALGDEWRISGGSASPRRRPERAIDRRQARAVAAAARRVETARGTPQDIEWAIDREGRLWILQARPMTALPPDVSWDAPAPGAYSRTLRFGEWISGPVTPLFESWLLSAMEERLHAMLRTWIGQIAPRPFHVVVNGWYFYSINFLSPGAMARSFPTILRQLLREPRRVAGIAPPTVRHSIPVFEREWRKDLQPRYRSAVASAEGRVETLPAADLPALIDGLAELAGEYFASIAALGGSAYKMEMNLAGFLRRHVRPPLAGGHLPLLAGLEVPAAPDRHAVASLDWSEVPAPTSPEVPAPASARGATQPELGQGHDRLVERRQAAEAAAYAALASKPARARAFARLLAQTQHVIPIREEQARELTIAWPVMRRAVLRIGEELTGRGLIAGSDDVFYLTRDEVLARLVSRDEVVGLPVIDVAGRRARRAEQGRLVPPLTVGRMNPVLRSLWEMFPKLVGAVRSDRALVSGSPASPGRVSGPVRVIRGPSQFGELQPGEILVAPRRQWPGRRSSRAQPPS
ncbi:MAG: hypothetical protein HY264_04555 [Chloroflexi bacterium]|nr:hypothetical protein [Chloroflexota bacterium]